MIGIRRTSSRKGRAAAVHQALEALESLLPGYPVEERAGEISADGIRGKARQDPGAEHQGKADAEAEDIAGRRVQDLSRVPDDHVHHRQPDDEQNSRKVPVQVLTHRGGVPVDRVAHRPAQGGDLSATATPISTPATVTATPVHVPPPGGPRCTTVRLEAPDRGSGGGVCGRRVGWSRHPTQT